MFYKTKNTGSFPASSIYQKFCICLEVGIHYKPITDSVLEKAAQLRRQQRAGALAAIHLASALQAQATHFITNDKEVLKKQIPSLIIIPLAEVGSFLSTFRK